jgi:hypothetical protein
MIRSWTTLVLITLITFSMLGQEICNNEIDDDGNGLIDYQDPSCTSCFGDMTVMVEGFFEDYDCCPSTFTVYGEDDGIWYKYERECL